MQDWCVTTPYVSPTITRQVTLSACLMASATSTLTGACQVNRTTAVQTLLVAVVDFDDHNGENPATPNCTSSANQSTRGQYLTVVGWISIRLRGSLASVDRPFDGGYPLIIASASRAARRPDPMPAGTPTPS